MHAKRSLRLNDIHWFLNVLILNINVSILQFPIKSVLLTPCIFHFGQINDKVYFVEKVTINNLRIISRQDHDLNTCKVSKVSA